MPRLPASRPWSRRWRRRPPVLCLCLRPVSLLLPLALLLAGGGVAAAQPAAQRLRAWGDGQRLELLPLQQSSLEVLARSRTTLLLRPFDLEGPTPELWIIPPATLDGRALARQLRLCRLRLPVDSRRARCLEDLPLRLEASATGLRLLPQAPLQPQVAYGVVLLLRNPLQQGFHPLRLLAPTPERPGLAYVGTWLLQTNAQTD